MLKPIYPSIRAQDSRESELYEQYFTDPDYIRQAICDMDDEILWELIEEMSDDELVEAVKNTSWPHAATIIKAVKSNVMDEVNEQMDDFIDGYAAQCHDREMEMRAEERREARYSY